MEACGGAHEWAREFQGHGHRIGIMMARFVAPYRKSSKNDGNDAERSAKRWLGRTCVSSPVKSAEQQAILSLHRVRQGFIEQRTATINRIRGLLAEFGVVLPQRAEQIRRAAESWPKSCRCSRATPLPICGHILRYLDERIAATSGSWSSWRASEAAATDSALARRWATHRFGDHRQHRDGHEFANGRQFAAWLGLVPRQYSTGGKTRLGRITKRGDAYLRTLLMLGARAVLQSAAQKSDRLSRWAMALRERRGYHRAIIAVAAKNARIIWALLANNREFTLPVIADIAHHIQFATLRRLRAQCENAEQVRPASGHPD